jgi:hypothetical protein
MTSVAVGVIGYDAIGCRVVDAITRQSDLHVAGVVESHPLRLRVLKARGIKAVAEGLDRWAASCQAMVVCRHEPQLLVAPAVYPPHVRKGEVPCLAEGLAASQLEVRIPCADAVALQRIADAFPTATRILSSSAGAYGKQLLDALEPVFDLAEEDADVQSIVGLPARQVVIRRTRVPYSHSHLHHLKIDLRGPMSAADAAAALQGGRRVRLATGRTAFANTGLLREYDRDLGRSRGDRPEVFVWEESIASVGRSVFFAADVDPVATVIPEIVDAVRYLSGSADSLASSRQITDGAVAVGGAR